MTASEIAEAIIAQADAWAAEAGRPDAACAMAVGSLRVELVAALDALAHAKTAGSLQYLARLERRLESQTPISES